MAIAASMAPIKATGVIRYSNAGNRIMMVMPAIPAPEEMPMMWGSARAAFHHMQSSEELNLPTAYDYPRMNEIRSIVKDELPGAKIHYALHFRYLLEWSTY